MVIVLDTDFGYSDLDGKVVMRDVKRRTVTMLAVTVREAVLLSASSMSCSPCLQSTASSASPLVREASWGESSASSASPLVREASQGESNASSANP